MTKQDLLSLSHYYRGEVKCPFDSETERPQGLFWMFEELFVRHSLNDPTFLSDPIANMIKLIVQLYN